MLAARDACNRLIVNSVRSVNQRSREFEARFSVTMPVRPWFREVTEIPISKQRSRPERRGLRKSLRTNGKTRNAGRSCLSAVSGNSWGVGSSRRASKLPVRGAPRNDARRDDLSKWLMLKRVSDSESLKVGRRVVVKNETRPFELPGARYEWAAARAKCISIACR
jgi:hypothetical protein